MLIERNLEDGIHTRPERQYWERIRRIKNKLMEVLNVATPNNSSSVTVGAATDIRKPEQP